jgi:hypothetical protein
MYATIDYEITTTIHRIAELAFIFLDICHIGISVRT